MSRLETIAVQLVILSVMLLGLPLAGISISGQALSPYLTFPPLTERVAHLAFDWRAFALIAVLTALIAAAVLYLLRSPPRGDGHPAGRGAHGTPLPVWGRIAVAWLLIAWWLSWNRAGWTEAVQPLKFPLLWLGYIGVVNAWTFQRSGRCLLCHRPGYLALLFPVSAVFWWYFEYLNRFVGNWYYLGVDDYTAAEYILYSTIAFSTVLPAVVSTAELLRTFRLFERPRRTGPALSLPRPRAVAAAGLALAGLGLAGIGLWPNYLFPLLWAAPLLIILSLQTLTRTRSYLAPLAAGDWRVVVVPACAALACGVLWELWNYYSWPKWSYSLPLVDRFEVFEMPLLGYAGYLPFGLECAVAADLVNRALAHGTDRGPAD